MMCLVFWDKKIIDGVYRKLSSRNILYTQLYLPDQIWSIVLEFSTPPIEQGYECIADEVYFLADTARIIYWQMVLNLTFWMAQEK